MATRSTNSPLRRAFLSNTRFSMRPDTQTGRFWRLAFALFTMAGMSGHSFAFDVPKPKPQASEAPAKPAPKRKPQASRTDDDEAEQPRAKAPQADLAPAVGTVFNDCATCPNMVMLPSGSFMMGSSASEAERDADEGPRHEVVINYKLAVGQSPITRDQFTRFVRDTGYVTAAEQSSYGGCFTWDSSAGKYAQSPGRNWRDPGFSQDGDEPVVCVTWDDANAYVRWLQSQTRKGSYRLLSEAEWEYAARAGSTSRYFWGNDADHDQQCSHANGLDKTGDFANKWGHANCADGAANTSPVRKYRPNGFGLYDMSGNVSQWTADVYHDSYNDAPMDGSVWTTGGEQTWRVGRGGAWFSSPRLLRSANRDKDRTTGALYIKGFRIARTF
jgi:formylglycine-generating enzyme required for sulfatase activity